MRVVPYTAVRLLLLAAVGGAASEAVAQARPTDAGRIAVGTFANKTGKGKYKAAGAEAAAAVTAFIVKEKVADVASNPKDRTVAVRVDGSYTEQDGKLAFTVRFTDGSGKKAMGTFGPVTGATGDYTALAEQVAAALDARRLWGDEDLMWPPSSSWASWLEYRAGADLFTKSDWAGALKHYRAAEKLDPPNARVKYGIWVSYGNLGQTAQSDSMEAVVQPLVATLGEPARDQFAWLSLSHQRRWEDQYVVAKRAYARSQRFGYNLAYPAIRSGRFTEALDLYRTRDMSEPWNRVWRAWDYIPVFALHAQERFDDALAMSRDFEKLRGFDFGTAYIQLYQLAAAGRFQDVEDLLARVATLPITVANTYGGVLNVVGWEYRAHGFEQQAQDIFRRRAAYYRGLSPEQQVTYRVAMASAIVQSGDYVDGKARVEALLAAVPNNLANLGTAAYLAVMSGDDALGAKVEARLAAENRPRNKSDALYWRGATAASKGDCATAEKLLREGLAVGITRFDYGFHWYYSTGKGKACTALPAIYGEQK